MGNVLLNGGPVIYTFSGRYVNPLDLQPEDVTKEDIAHHLALLNRFVGATKKPINIAQHSVYVSRLVFKWMNLSHYSLEARRGEALRALFHDAEEAYLGDVTKWVKETPEMLPFRRAAYRAHIAIFRALGLQPFAWNEEQGRDVLPTLIDRADRLMVRFEGRHRHGCGSKFRVPTYPELTKEDIEAVGAWKPWTWQASQEGFLTQHRLLTGEFR